MTEAVPGEIHLAWVPERSDYGDAFAARNRARKLRWRFAAGYAMAGIAIAGGLALDEAFDVGVGGGLAVFVTVLLASQPVAIRRFWTGTPYMREPSTAVLTPRGGLSTKTARVSAHWDWTLFVDALETDRSFVVQLRGRRKLIVVLPKRGFSDPGDVARARAMLGELEGGVRPI